jgi:hypothetical protein
VLRKAGVVFDAGLSDAEIESVEKRHRFTFPPDLRAFLAAALPVSDGFVDWRHASDADLRSRFDWPLEGIAFDIEHNAFWLPEWGVRPESLADAIVVARSAVDAAPRLVPICSHRFIADRPSEAGNPILSVYQTDIILYGADLAQYLENEFPDHFGTPRYQIRKEARRIDLWSRLVAAND